MSKENEVICPVYFDGKALRKDRNINAVFTSGFNAFRIMNKLNAKVAEVYFKEDEESVDKNFLMNTQRYTIRNCAATYAKANIFDLVIQTMNAFRTEIITTYPGCFVFHFGAEETDKLRDILNNKIACCSDNPKSNTEAFLRGNLNGISVYNEIYFNIFESTIVNSMNLFLGNNVRIMNRNNNTKNTEYLLDCVYRKMYKDCYGDDSDIDLSISFELKYNFISSILREIMSKYLANLAVGINSILYNAGLMMTYSTTDPMNKALGIKSSEVIDPYIFDDWRKIDL